LDVTDVEFALKILELLDMFVLHADPTLTTEEIMLIFARNVLVSIWKKTKKR